MMLSASEQTTKRCSQWSVDFICLAIFLVSIVIRFVKLFFEPLLLRDAALYLRLAEIWHKTGEYLEITKDESRIPPLPLWCIKTLTDFIGNPEISGRSISLFLGGLIPVIGFVAARKITHNIRFSLIAALCFVFHPNLVAYSTQPLRENYYIFLIGLLLIVMIRNFTRTGVAGWIACGVIIGIAFFCRLEALEFLIIVIAEIAFLELKKKKMSCFFRDIGIFLLAFVLASFSLLACTGGDYFFITRAKNYGNRFVSELSNTAHL